MLRQLSPLWDAYLYGKYQVTISKGNPKIGHGLIFIIGASGSGTTMLTRILSSPPEIIGLGGNFDSIPKDNKKAVRLARIFKQATRKLWDRKAGFEVLSSRPGRWRFPSHRRSRPPGRDTLPALAISA